jgi:hypothetical protein
LLLPVITAVKLPATVALHETVAIPEPVTLVGANDPQIRPAEGAMLKVTVPANPLMEATVTVEVADWPALTASGDEAVVPKSWKRRTTEAEWDREPLVPVTVRV